jgi:hypothetical protein
VKQTIVTDAPISDPDAPFFAALTAAMDALTAQHIALELEEHGPTLGFDLLWFVHRPSATHLRIWEDYRAKVKYLELEGTDATLLATLRATLEQHLAPPTLEQLVARARRSRSDPTALMRAVYAARDGTPPDERVVELVTAALAHPLPPMRDLASYAAQLLGLPA